MSRLNSEYWAERIEQLTIQNIRIGDATSKELSKYYQRTAKEVSESLELYYSRYGENNVIEFIDLLQKADKRQLQAIWEDWELFVKHHPEYAELQPIRQSFYKYTRLDALNSDIHLKMLNLQAEENRLVQECLEETARKTHNRVKKALSGMGVNTNNIHGLSEDMIKEFMNIKWTQDSNFSERIWSNNSKLVDYIHNTIRESVIRGESYEQAAKMMDLKFQTGIKNAKRLVHTESAFIQEEVTFRSYEECGVVEYEYMSMIDSKTSDVCTALDGKRFKLKDAKVGLNRAPMHPWCRGTSIPILPKR